MKHQADLLIRNSDYLDETFELTEGKSILISDGKIEAVGTAAELEERYQWKEELDGSGCIYMPGLVDSHMHTGQQLLRGRVLDEMPMIWTRIMLPYESTLTPEKMRLSAQAAAVEMIHAGTTGFIDAGSYFMEEAAKVISATYHCAVLCKGGHQLNDANDLLYREGAKKWFYGKRIDNPNTHGTGCTLSSAIASNLAKGYELDLAVERAKEYISGALGAMLDLGKGSGPMDHGFDIQSRFSR